MLSEKILFLAVTGITYMAFGYVLGVYLLEH